jgi:hypothetical protein
LRIGKDLGRIVTPANQLDPLGQASFVDLRLKCVSQWPLSDNSQRPLREVFGNPRKGFDQQAETLFGGQSSHRHDLLAALL